MTYKININVSSDLGIESMKQDAIKQVQQALENCSQSFLRGLEDAGSIEIIKPTIKHKPKHSCELCNMLIVNDKVHINGNRCKAEQAAKHVLENDLILINTNDHILHVTELVERIFIYKHHEEHHRSYAPKWAVEAMNIFLENNYKPLRIANLLALGRDNEEFKAELALCTLGIK